MSEPATAKSDFDLLDEMQKPFAQLQGCLDAVRLIGTSEGNNDQNVASAMFALAEAAHRQMDHMEALHGELYRRACAARRGEMS